jgi:hypothetical protein
MLFDRDGFLNALACGPEVISADQWLVSRNLRSHLLSL